jgi:hypothetical protein
MTRHTNHGRLTLLGMTAILSGLAGCSLFKEQAAPKLAAEVTPGPTPGAPPAAKYVVEIHPENGKPQSVEKPLTETTHVQSALEQTGADKKFGRAIVEVYRPLPTGGWHKMTLEFDHRTKRVPPEYDYAVLPGDRIVVTEDPRTVADDFMERVLLMPLGIQRPNKAEAIKSKYQIQG